MRAQVNALQTKRLLSEIVHEVGDPEPGEEIEGFEREAVAEARMGLRDHVGEGMRKGARGTPGHGEHDLERSVERLRYVDVSLARGIRDHRVGHEGGCVGMAGIGLGAGGPGGGEDLGHYLPLARHLLEELTGPERDQPATRHYHVLHELPRIAGQRKELDAVGLHELAEHRMGRDSHSVSVVAQALRNGQEGLYVAPRADD